MVAMIVLQGCATKNFGRQGELTGFERSTMTCREMDLEIAKVDGFIDKVNSESKFDAKQVLAILGDFGIGNSMEKSAALESAMARKKQLQEVKVKRKCK